LGSLLESVDHNRNITSLILQLKDSLMKKNLVCSTQYIKPTPEKNHRDYGYCRIRIDTNTGRGKSMTPKAIAKSVWNICSKINLSKYFTMEDTGHDGRYCEVGLSLKPKYVEKYLIS